MQPRANLGAGRAVASSGPILEVSARTDSGEANIGELISAGTSGLTLNISVRMPEWYDVTCYEAFINQTEVHPNDTAAIEGHVTDLTGIEAGAVCKQQNLHVVLPGDRGTPTDDDGSGILSPRLQ